MPGVRLGMMTISGLLNKNTSYMNYINYLALYLENRGSGIKSIILQKETYLLSMILLLMKAFEEVIDIKIGCLR